MIPFLNFLILLLMCWVNAEKLQNHQPESYAVYSVRLSGTNSGLIGTYGEKGVPSRTSRISSRHSLCMVMNPTNENVLIFGGGGLASEQFNHGMLNDLWEYEKLLKTWTWLSGSDIIDQPGYYGQLNVAAPENVPSARQGHAMVSDPSRKSVWIFGGERNRNLGNFSVDEQNVSNSEIGLFNDLWEWTPETNVWIWRSGSEGTDLSGYFGTKKKLDYRNVPPSRRYHTMSLHPKTGALVLFAGFINDAFNDLWYFYPEESMWIWMSGNSAAQMNNVVSDEPIGRYGHSQCTQNQSLYVFGGRETQNWSPLNDLWKWDFAQEKWSLLQPNKNTSLNGVYGIFNQRSSGNWPGARYHHTMAIDEQSQMLILFGGLGYDSINTAQRLWTWIAGSLVGDQPSLIQDSVLSKSNMIGSRYLTSMIYNETQDLYIFGGFNGKSELNDMWHTKIKAECRAGSIDLGMQCVSCPSGMFINGNQCDPCPVGSYSDQLPNTVCTNCSEGLYQPYQGQWTCLNCPDYADCTATKFTCRPGFTSYAINTGCIECPQGYWKPESGNQPCFKCSENAMTCERSKCVLPNGRSCPITSIPNFWMDNPAVAISILFLGIWILLSSAFVVGFFSIQSIPRAISTAHSSTKTTDSPLIKTTISYDNTLTDSS